MKNIQTPLPPKKSLYLVLLNPFNETRIFFQTEQQAANQSLISPVQQIKSQLILFSKLFVIMGITWICECLHVQVHGDHSDVKECNYYSEVCKIRHVNLFWSRLDPTQSHYWDVYHWLCVVYLDKHLGAVHFKHWLNE